MDSVVFGEVFSFIMHYLGILFYLTGLTYSMVSGFVFLWISGCANVYLSESLSVSCAYSLAHFFVCFVLFCSVSFYFICFFFIRYSLVF